MLVSQACDGNDYVLDTSKLKNITLPTLYDNMQNVYFIEADKIVMLPVKFSFGQDKDKITLNGSIYLPDRIEKCVVRFTNDAFIRAMAIAINSDIGIEKVMPIKAGIDNELKFLYSCLVKKLRNALVIGEKYPYTSFIINNGKIVGISNSAFFEEDADDLIGVFSNSVGTYLSMFESEKDLDVSVVIVDDNYKEFAVFNGFISDVENEKITVIKKEIKNTSSSALCETIAKKYHGNYMKYFLEQQEEERSKDIFADF